jgi:apolipoprotein N-acyltransferase
VAWVATAPLILTLAREGLRGRASRAFLLGVTTGLVYFGGTVYWVAPTMELYGGLPAAVAVPIAALLAAYLSIFTGLFGLLVQQAVSRLGSNGIWLAAPLWVATEWLRASAGPGFPWVLLGTSQASILPVVQLASVVGVYGLSAFLVLLATAAAVAAQSARASRLAAGAVAAFAVGVVGWGSWRVADGRLLDAGEPLRVGLVQGSVPQDQKWDPRYRDTIIARYLDLSRRAIDGGAGLVLWPESSTPFPLDTNTAMATPIRSLAVERGVPFIIGSDRSEPGLGGDGGRYFNSAALIGADGQTRQWYDKMRLAPFGEYVPFKSILFFVGPLVEKVSDFSAGTEPVVFDANGHRVSVAICYESIYPDLARQFVRRGSALLATITNDAWFGTTSAPYQHFEQAAVRAVEQGRFLVRAANTGISGAVDPYGRVVAATPLFEPAALTVDVRLLTGRTIYSRVGDIVVWVSLVPAVWLAAGVVGRQRARRT